MPDETTLRQETAGPQLEVAGPSSGSVKKVELDLDDAPFLQDDLSAPAELREDDLPQIARESGEDGPVQDAHGKRKKRLIIIAGGLVLLGALGAAAWRFMSRPPAPVAEPPKPEVIVVPSKPQAPARQEFIKEFAPFVVPRNAREQAVATAGQTAPAGEDTRFLICKFSALTTDPAVDKEMDQQMIPLRDAIYYYLRSKSSQYLMDARNGAEIKKDLTAVLNDYLTQGTIEDILFEGYLNK